MTPLLEHETVFRNTTTDEALGFADIPARIDKTEFDFRAADGIGLPFQFAHNASDRPNRRVVTGNESRNRNRS